MIYVFALVMSLMAAEKREAPSKYVLPVKPYTPPNIATDEDIAAGQLKLEQTINREQAEALRQLDLKSRAENIEYMLYDVFGKRILSADALKELEMMGWKPSPQNSATSTTMQYETIGNPKNRVTVVFDGARSQRIYFSGDRSHQVLNFTNNSYSNCMQGVCSTVTENSCAGNNGDVDVAHKANMQALNTQFRLSATTTNSIVKDPQAKKLFCDFQIRQVKNSKAAGSGTTAEQPSGRR